MTEKRFTLISHEDLQLYDFIEDNGKVIHTSKVVDVLNKFNDTVEEYYSYIKRLERENEQLKQQLIDVDKLIDDKIKEYQKYDEYDTEKYYIGTQLLKELKKELKGDVE